MSTRQRENTTLAKSTGLCYRPQSVTSITTEDGFDVFIQGQDFRIDADGKVEVLNDDLVGKKVIVTYER
jgi:hypothetical protein